MGRVLAKRFFGDTSTGATGEDVASVTVAGTNNNYTAKPAITFTAPPAGVTAVAGAVTMKAVTPTITAAGAGVHSVDYAPTETLTLTGSGVGTQATFTVSSVKVRAATQAVAAAGSGYFTGDTVTFGDGTWTTPAVFTLTVDPSTITATGTSNAGSRSIASALTDPVTADSSSGSGTGATFNIGCGVRGVVPAAPGTYTVVPASPVATTTNSATGTGATLTPTWRSPSAAVAAGGTAYSVGQTLTAVGGTGTPATFTVASLVGADGTAVATVTMATPGAYTVPPANPVATTGGTSSDCTLTVTWEMASAVVATSGTGDVSADYISGEVLTLVGGTGGAATATITDVKVRTAVVVGQGNGKYFEGDTVTFSTAFNSIAAVLTLTVTAGAINAVALTNAGVRTTTLPTQPLVHSATTSVHGAGATFNAGFDVNTVALATGGSYTTLPTNPVATTGSAAGAGCTLTITGYGVNTVPVATAGSGYLVAPTVIDSLAGNATLTAVLTSTHPNAIVAHAYTGGTLKVASIVKQSGSRRYRVTTTDTTEEAYLTAIAAAALGEMNIMAYDANGSSYFVDKLTRHHAILTRGTVVGSFVWATGDAVNWWFDAADADHCMIENA